MPTSSALDVVAKRLKLPLFEVLSAFPSFIFPCFVLAWGVRLGVFLFFLGGCWRGEIMI